MTVYVTRQYLSVLRRMREVRAVLLVTASCSQSIHLKHESCPFDVRSTKFTNDEATTDLSSKLDII